MNNEERNAFVERRYDELRMEGKHGHYECLFRVVHEIVDAELARVREELLAARAQAAQVVLAYESLSLRTERVARRAYRTGHKHGKNVVMIYDEAGAVAQAMREEG